MVATQNEALAEALADQLAARQTNVKAFLRFNLVRQNKPYTTRCHARTPEIAYIRSGTMLTLLRNIQQRNNPLHTLNSNLLNTLVIDTTLAEAQVETLPEKLAARQNVNNSFLSIKHCTIKYTSYYPKASIETLKKQRNLFTYSLTQLANVKCIREFIKAFYETEENKIMFNEQCNKLTEKMIIYIDTDDAYSSLDLHLDFNDELTFDFSSPD